MNELAVNLDTSSEVPLMNRFTIISSLRFRKGRSCHEKLPSTRLFRAALK